MIDTGNFFVAIKAEGWGTVIITIAIIAKAIHVVLGFGYWFIKGQEWITILVSFRVRIINVSNTLGLFYSTGIKAFTR